MKKIKYKPSVCIECNKEDTIFINPLSYGSVLDSHMDIELDVDELNKKIADAVELSHHMGGKLPGNIKDELDKLLTPKLTWQDFIRFASLRKKQSVTKNNWASPKRKLLCAGLYSPKKIEYKVSFIVFYDCSISMRKEQISYGLSQVAALKDRGEGWACPFDTQPYYDTMVEISKASLSELQKAKFKGGGGTALLSSLTSYEKEVGPVDIIIVITDGYLSDINEVLKWQPPTGTQIVWLTIKCNPAFTPTYGRMFHLYNESF